MNTNFFWPLFVSAGLLVHPLVASPLNDKISALKQAVEKDIALEQNKDSDGPLAPVHAKITYLLADLDQIVTALDDPNGVNNAEAEVSQILSGYSSPPVQKAGQDLLVEIRQERKVRADAALSKMQALQKRAGAVVGEAAKPEELDGILIDLQACLRDRYGYNAANQALFEQISSSFEFVKLWQNYLFHKASGQIELASNDLQSALQNSSGMDLIPRSEILQRLEVTTTPPAEPHHDQASVEFSKTTDLLKEIKALDDMEPVLLKLSALSQRNSQAVSAYNQLASLVQLYNNAKAGLPGIANLDRLGGDSDQGINPRLKVQLLNFVLHQYLDKNPQAQSTAGEQNPQTIVSLAIEDAIKTEDWPLLQKVFVAERSLSQNPVFAPYAIANVSGSVENLLAGVSQEAGGQYSMAVVSYQNALKLAATTQTAKLVGDKLAVIKKDHPEEYEEGMKEALASKSRVLRPEPTASLGPVLVTNPPPGANPGTMSQSSPALSVSTGTAAASSAPILAPPRTIMVAPAK